MRVRANPVVLLEHKAGVFRDDVSGQLGASLLRVRQVVFNCLVFFLSGHDALLGFLVQGEGPGVVHNSHTTIFSLHVLAAVDPDHFEL